MSGYQVNRGSGVSMSIDTSAASALNAHLMLLARLDKDGLSKDLRTDIGEYFLGEVQDNLDGQRLFDGQAMPQSAAAIERSGKTLIHKHHLYDSYVYQVVNGGVEVGSHSAYARIHHFGGETGRRNGRFTLPARPVLGLTDAGEEHIGNLIMAELERMTAGHGGAR